MTSRLLVWVCIACVMPMTIPPGWSADAIGKAFNQQVTQPVQDAVAIRQTTQKEQEQWRDDQHKLMALYDKLQSEQSRLLADREAFQENIRSAHKRITEKEKQLADIEQLRTRIEPFLQESAQALSQQLAQDLPFLPEERRQRVAG